MNRDEMIKAVSPDLGGLLRTLWFINDSLVAQIENTHRRTVLLMFLSGAERVAPAIVPRLFSRVAPTTWANIAVRPVADVVAAFPHLAEILATPLEVGEVFRLMIGCEQVSIDLVRVDGEQALASGRDFGWPLLPVNPPGGKTS